jgi:SAM-dependent methyltransferase
MHRLLAPVESVWLDAVRAVAADHRFASFDEPARLGASVARLSVVYNDPTRSDLRSAETALLEARLGFSLVRDLPKVTTAVRELCDAGLLRVRGAPLRVLDLGAGLGASTFGLVRALAIAGESGTVDAVLVDDNQRALALAADVARVIGKKIDIQLHVRTAVGNAASHTSPERFDVILLGQMVSELDCALAPDARASRHAAWIARLLQDCLEGDGFLLIVEPALRERTRHLHAVRDALMGEPGEPSVTLFAPCLQRQACPMLANPHDWCHEDLPVNLPDPLIPVARAAGLRFEGLTYSYLVLRRDGVTLRGRLGSRAPGLARVVSAPLVTKVKREWFLCGDAMTNGELTSAKTKAMRLDRERAPHNVAWDDARRGDILAFDPALDSERPRLAKGGTVTQVQASFDTQP